MNNTMKNIVCPISNERVPEHMPRVSAFFVISLIVIYIVTGFLPIILLLLADFFIRGFNQPQLSPVHFLALGTARILALRSPDIDKAPKLFAARLGGIMSVIIVAFHLAGMVQVASITGILLIVFSTLECVLNFCVGCYIYSWFVLPFFVKKAN